jgi:hypothetical protein
VKRRPTAKTDARKEVSRLKRFVPYKKLSKKQKRAVNAEKRAMWRISPVTRRPDNPKAYNRKKARKWEDDSSSVLSFY